MYAHTRLRLGCTDWEPLETHLFAVADRAANFAEVFGGGVLGHAVGCWHDLGKASLAFQRDVLGFNADEAASDLAIENEAATRHKIRVDHSTAGARHAVNEVGPEIGTWLAYAIAGHHGRLPNYNGDGKGGTLKERLDPASRTIPEITPSRRILNAVDLQGVRPPLLIPATDQALAPFQISVLIRTLYSALIDADRLETEKFCDASRAACRPGHPPEPGVLIGRLNAYLDALAGDQSNKLTPVNRHRARVLAACREKAALSPGVFTLTVPTGGGKTLASMVFALEHAKHHGQRRVVFALPFTSIIEQTAEVYRDVFGGRYILEHHSNLDRERTDRRSLTTQMTAENFDAPVIVTTNVQLFESLFSAHGSSCRKLHNLVGSVIVLDEAQTIPPHLLRPTLAMIEELVRNYRCTVVLCTATQPAVAKREGFDIGLENTTEIISDPPALYGAMKRVEVQHLGPKDDGQLTERLAGYPQVLCIVNTRKHAAELATRLQAHGPVVHLSAMMCPQHRSERVAEIKQALLDRKPIRVVSTQVIEAGVDVDFPVVFRALAGFDSIAQAAGRCNREGKHDRGRVFVFETEHPPAPSMRVQLYAARELIKTHPDPLQLGAIEAYFQQVYWRRSHEGKKPWDTHDVMGCFETTRIHQFRDADERFRWIDSTTTPILVPHGERGRRLIDHLRHTDDPDWRQLRAAQRYSVSVYDNQLQQLLDNTTVTNDLNEAFAGRFWVLTNEEAYDPTFGLRLDVDGIGIDSLISY